MIMVLVEACMACLFDSLVEAHRLTEGLNLVVSEYFILDALLSVFNKLLSLLFDGEW